MRIVLIFLGTIIVLGFLIGIALDGTPENKEGKDFIKKYGCSKKEAAEKVRNSPHVDSVARAIADYPYPDEIAVWHEVMHLDNTPVRFESLGFSAIPSYHEMFSAFLYSLMEKLPSFYELENPSNDLPIYITKKKPESVVENPMKDFL